MKLKLLLVLIFILTNVATWYFTKQYDKNITVRIISAARATDGKSIFSLSSSECQPLKLNGNCSTVVQQSYNFIASEAVHIMADKCRAILNGVPQASNPIHIENTDCHWDSFGHFTCTTIGR